MDTTTLLATAFGLWFLYEGMKWVLPWTASPADQRPAAPLLLFIYCFIVCLLLLYLGGLLTRHGPLLSN